MRSDILKILNDNSKGSDEEYYLGMPIGTNKGIHPDDFLHVADEIHKQYQTKQENIKEFIEKELDVLLEGNYLVNSSDKTNFISVVVNKIKGL